MFQLFNTQAQRAGRAFLLGLLLAAAAAVSCAGHGGMAPVPQFTGPLSSFPAPSVLAGLPKPRQASYVESDLVKNGADFNAAMPNNLAVANGTACDFSPAFTAGTGLAHAAYCVYNYNAKSYDRSSDIRYSWSSAPASGALWLGLGHWSKDRWDWYQADPAQRLNLAAISPYIRNDGALVLAVVCLGATPASLDWVRLGTQPPVASLLPTPSAGFIPFIVTLDGSGSTDPDGSIASYDWDINGDGIYDQLDAGNKIFLNMSSAMALKVSLRVTDNEGVSAVTTTTVSGFEEWVHSWGGSAIDGLLDCAYDGADGLYFGGVTGSFGAGNRDMLLLKYNLAGSLVWARTWGTALDETGTSVALDGNGDIILAGWSLNGQAAEVVKFSPGGSVLWAQGYNDGSFATPVVTSVSAWGSDIYVGGYFRSFSAPYYAERGMLLKFSGDGTLQWARDFKPAGDCRINAIKVRSVLFGSPSIYAAGVSASDMFYLHASTDGNLLLAKTWGGVQPDEEAFDINVYGFSLLEVWLAGEELTGGQYSGLLLQYAGGTPVCKAWSGGGTDDSLNSLVRLGDGSFFLSGSTNSFSAAGDGLLLGFSSGAVLQQGARLHDSSAACNLEGSLELLSGVALAGCGDCGKAANSGWSSANGTLSGRSYTWQTASGDFDTLDTTYVSDPGGASGTPGSAVLDSGGGDVDALAFVRKTQ